MPTRRGLLMCALWLCLARAREELIAICPDDYSPSPSEDCVPLHQLLSTLHLIHSNTTIQLLPAVFKLGPDLSISIANVSNITVGAAGPHRATISCTGSNSGFVFKNVSGLTLQSMNITNCGAPNRSSHQIYKYSVIILESTNLFLNNIKFMGNGVYAENIRDNFITCNALFTEIVNSTAFKLITTILRISELFVSISNSEFLNSDVFSLMNISSRSSSRIYLSNITVRNNVIISNALYFALNFYDKIQLERLTLKDNTPLYNTIEHPGAISVQERLVELLVADCQFSNNSMNVLHLQKIPKLHINNTIFSSNRGSAVIATILPIEKFIVTIYGSTFTDNTCSDGNAIVTIFLMRPLKTVFLQDSTFLNNRGTGLKIYNSEVLLAGTNLFINNTAQNGAAIVLDLSYITIKEDNTTLHIEGNVAENFGGGIYVQKTFDSVHVHRDCKIEVLRNKSVVVHFNDNVAHLAGNDIYGGNLYPCTSDLSSLVALRAPTGYKIDVASTPIRVCECSEQNIHTCVHPTKVIGTVETYPGKQFNLSLLAVGQVVNLTLLSGAPGTVHSSILLQKSPTELKTGSIPGGMLVQESLRTCSNLTYSINSTREYETLVLSLGGLTKDDITRGWTRNLNATDVLYNPKEKYSNVPAYVKVHLLPCPAGFNLSLHSACICSDALQHFDVECNIDILMIRRKSPHFWLAMNVSLHYSGKVLAHRHCPFDFCKPDVLDLNLADTDALCNHNRSGILCGACRSGFSLILGGTECRQCSNIYLLLLLPFALAGILLVVFLSLTDMTVAAGTINGLLFYANIVTDNKATFFPPGAEDSFLSVFVQWLSLDLGIKSCFFDGLDAYTYTWLQLVFPVYVCLLAFAIIIASRYITWMNKLCGTNIVQVLATLFLLSYTKLQATIASGLSFTAVEVYDEEKLFVWLKDGNVPYLQGKHIALFLVSLLLLCVFSLYTLSIALGPWLQRKTQYKVFCWVVKLKPLFDAYFGPLKNQYRYWTGLLLLSKTVLYLVSSVNVFGDDSVNLLAIAILCLLLTWPSSSIYKHKVFSALDSFFLINLCILALVSLYNKLSSGGSQTVTIYVSSGSAFAVFCVTLLYHCFSRLKKVISGRHNLAHRDDETSAAEDSDNELLDDLRL